MSHPFYICGHNVSYLDVKCCYKQATFVGSFKAIKLNDSLFFYSLFLTLSLFVFSIFLPLCCLSLVFTYLWSVSHSVSVSVFFFSPFLFLWGCGWKPSLNISVLHFLSFFMLPLFSRPLWCVCGFVIIPFGWAHRRRCAGTRMHLRTHHVYTHSHSVFLYWRPEASTCKRAF